MFYQHIIFDAASRYKRQEYLLVSHIIPLAQMNPVYRVQVLAVDGESCVKANGFFIA